jgi:hypothetical protein
MLGMGLSVKSDPIDLMAALGEGLTAEEFCVNSLSKNALISAS